MQAQKRRLGRGLAALIGDDVVEAASPEEFRGLRHLPIELLHSNPNNPRKQFREEELEDLSKSIREKGLLQPIVVRQRALNERNHIFRRCVALATHANGKRARMIYEVPGAACRNMLRQLNAYIPAGELKCGGGFHVFGIGKRISFAGLIKG